MPAQKLTKTRVIQLIIALIILISAFLYRSYHHSQPQSPVKIQIEQSE
ncbi:hypothetical protein [Spirabiliibacterium falconis]|nr:hypothetical protein [Spirabiliibacterium falconis]MBE2894159.1 hypothetical protein [Spirabiliibacterium falconis]